MCQVSLGGCDQGRVLPKGHVGAVVRNLAEPSFDHNQPETGHRCFYSIRSPNGCGRVLDRVLLSENADSQVGGGIRHRFLERFSFACAIKPVHHRMREGGDVGFEEGMANNLWPMVRNEKSADYSEEHIADTI